MLQQFTAVDRKCGLLQNPYREGVEFSRLTGRGGLSGTFRENVSWGGTGGRSCFHLNPLRAKQVDRYRYSGHRVLVGNRPNEWQVIGAVLCLFGKLVSTPEGFRYFVVKGWW